jgi:hypothetical protein
MIWNEDFDPKIRTFWVFGGGGKEKMALCACLLGFERKIVLSVS